MLYSSDINAVYNVIYAEYNASESSRFSKPAVTIQIVYSNKNRIWYYFLILFFCLLITAKLVYTGIFTERTTIFH